MATIVREGEGYLVCCKGDAATLLQRCRAILKEDGSTKKLLPEDNVKLEDAIQLMEHKNHLKVMCIASRRLYSAGRNSSCSGLC